MKKKFIPLIASIILFICSEIVFLNLKINSIFYFSLFIIVLSLVVFHLMINSKKLERKYWYLILQFILFSLICYFFCFSFTNSFFLQMFLVLIVFFLFIFLKNICYLFNQPRFYDFLLEKRLNIALTLISVFCLSTIFYSFTQLKFSYIYLIMLFILYFWEYFYLLKNENLAVNNLFILSISGLSVILLEFFIALNYLGLNIFFNALLILLIFTIIYLLWIKKKKFMFRVT